jgi:hypothetical protein
MNVNIFYVVGNAETAIIYSSTYNIYIKIISSPNLPLFLLPVVGCSESWNKIYILCTQHIFLSRFILFAI